MHSKLIIEAFEKAKKETGSRKKTRWSEHLSDYISENSKDTFTEKSLRTYYDRIKQDDKTHVELKSFVVNALLKYLGYSNFKDFLNRNEEGEKVKGNPLMERMKNYKTTILTSSLLILLGYVGYDSTKKDCMVWVDNRYEKVNCNQVGSADFIPVVFKNLEKVQPGCDYPFFKANGKENLWYGKSLKGELEYFTYPGIHPETEETLKKITQHIIDKYICAD